MKLTTSTPEFQMWFARAKIIVDDEHNFLTFKDGQRYIKIINNSYGQKSAFAFIDKNTGDVLKSSTWSAPAKHSRGNIFDEYHGTKWITKYGMAYLR